MMAMLLLTSPGGAPGLTTTALGLALSWPRHRIRISRWSHSTAGWTDRIGRSLS